MKIILENFKCLSWNDMQNIHWSLRAQEKKNLQNAVYALAYNLGKKEKVNIPALVKIEAHFKDGGRHDPDNLYVKPILDGLVRAGVFEDDNGKIIDWVCSKAEVKMPSDQIIIYINE
ncbi:MAG: hypothetical protein WC823_00115 [Parcubacteria group bacterium]|jgi:Holliday junction resolvase RusA-like endonuclease